IFWDPLVDRIPPEFAAKVGDPATYQSELTGGMVRMRYVVLHALANHLKVSCISLRLRPTRYRIEPPNFRHQLNWPPWGKATNPKAKFDQLQLASLAKPTTDKAFINRGKFECIDVGGMG
ncbi:hypothetical protein L0F63_004752, partial [Massospora cicadina]